MSTRENSCCAVRKQSDINWSQWWKERDFPVENHLRQLAAVEPEFVFF